MGAWAGELWIDGWVSTVSFVAAFGSLARRQSRWMPRRLELGPGWDELVARQRLVVSRAQLRDHGWTPDALSHRLSSGEWQELLPCVYLMRRGEAQAWHRRMAALLYAGDDAALDALDALANHGVGLVIPRGDCVDVVARKGGQARSRDGIRVRRTTALIHTITIDGLPTAELPTALVVAARRLTRRDDVVALLSHGLQQRRLTLKQLREANAAGPPRGRPRITAVLDELAPGARHPAELEFMRLVASSRVLPRPKCNVWVRLPNGVERCLDALFEDAALVHETIGRRVHEREDLLGSTLVREAGLEAVGLDVMSNLASRIRHSGQEVLAEVEAAYLHRRGRGMPASVVVLDGPSR